MIKEHQKEFNKRLDISNWKVLFVLLCNLFGIKSGKETEGNLFEFYELCDF